MQFKNNGLCHIETAKYLCFCRSASTRLMKSGYLFTNFCGFWCFSEFLWKTEEPVSIMTKTETSFILILSC